MVASGADDMGGYVFQLALQSAMTDEEAKASLGGGDWTIPNAIKGVKTFVQLRDAGVFVDGVEGVDYAGAEAKFGEGKTAMCHYGAWAFADPAMLPLNPVVSLEVSRYRRVPPINYLFTSKRFPLRGFSSPPMVRQRLTQWRNS